MIRKIISFSPIFKNTDNIILRDYLALERTKLANERTLLSYVRASLYLLLGGIAFLQLQGFDGIKWMGYVSLALSVILIVIGVVRYYQLNRRLRQYYVDTKEELEQKKE